MGRSAWQLIVAVLALSFAGPAVRAADPSGQPIFEGACAACHAAGSPRVLSGQKLLSDTRAITGDDPAKAIRLILNGHQPPPEQRGAWMPAYADTLDDAQIASVLAWLRERAGAPPWTGLTQRVQALRASAATGGER